jgi:mono/diheme cytochrome c family protein
MNRRTILERAAPIAAAILFAAMPVTAQPDPPGPPAASAGATIQTQADAQPASPATSAPPAAAEFMARGEYLVNILGCNDCHTPMAMGPDGPAPDMTRMLSGHPEGLELAFPEPMPTMPWAMVGSATNTAFAGPWGISFATNLTPEEVTGMGIWTEDMFVKALRKGRHMGVSRPIMPPMPWPAYGQMTDDDLRAVFAFLKSIPPIRNRVPAYLPPPGAEESFTEAQ